MSPNPLRATITEVIKSGMDVPAARKVRPMTYWFGKNMGEKGLIRLQAKSRKERAFSSSYTKNIYFFCDLKGHKNCLEISLALLLSALGVKYSLNLERKLIYFKKIVLFNYYHIFSLRIPSNIFF